MLQILGFLLCVAGVAVAMGLATIALLLWRVSRHNQRLRVDASPRFHARRVIRHAVAPDPITLVAVPTVSATEAVVVWATADAALTRVRVVTAGAEEAVHVVDEPLTRAHRVCMGGLMPETAYRVHVGADTVPDTPVLEFTTLPDIGRVRFCFAAITDTHFKRDAWTWPDGRLYGRGREVHERLLAQMLGHNPAFILHKGDCSEPPGERRLAAYGDAMRHAGVPVHYIPGNHDYFHHRNFRADWVTLTGSADTYRSFAHGDVHFVLLDTCWTGEQERGFLGARQLRWLEAELTAHRGVPTIVVTHHPIFGDPAENRVCHDAAALCAVLAGHGRVTAVLSGHVHRNLVRWSDQLPGVPNIETASGIQYPVGYALYEVGELGLRQSFHIIDDFALSIESWRRSWLRSVTNPSEPMGCLTDRNFVLPWPADGDSR